MQSAVILLHVQTFMSDPLSLSTCLCSSQACTHSVSRSLDNQVYTAGVSPARDEKATYVAWGHSTLANPW